MDDPTVWLLEGKAANAVPVRASRNSIDQFEKCEFALSSYDCVHKGFPQRLVGRQTRVPPTENDRQLRPKFLHGARHANSRPNMRSGQYGDAQTESVFRFAKNGFFVVRAKQVIDELDFKSGLEQWRCKT